LWALNEDSEKSFNTLFHRPMTGNFLSPIKPRSANLLVPSTKKTLSMHFRHMKLMFLWAV
jgi:hypothetical protein